MPGGRSVARVQAGPASAVSRCGATKPVAILLLAGLWLMSATPVATAADEAADPAAIEFFEKRVRPILVQQCYECHSTEDVNGGLLLDSRDGVRNGGDTGPVLIPGKPDESLLIEAVRYQNRDLQMPPQNRLSDEEIAALEKWVEMGAPDPREAVAGTAAPGPTGMSIEDGREFWSFRPVADPQVPDVSAKDWVRTPIDAFLLARLEEQGLEPAPPADKRTLIRRVTFDLTGLPPTPEEIQAFLADDSPEAFDKVVERLLQSPHYGVRWGRHWLDVARYADSNGLDENLAFGNAWRYRDYVVNAFNSDKPFDQFLMEQIAGDLLPDANRETKIATGFLVLGAKVLAEPDREKLAMDTIDEQLDTTGKAFMGVTLGCVRCHDHKFDPLKQTDYYALAAIFKGTKTFGDTNTGAIKHWHEYSFATDEDREKLKEADARIAELKRAASSFKNKAMGALRTEARAKVTEYLVAAAGFDTSMPLTQVEAIAEPLGLHPRILHHCRLHLDYHRDAPLFQPWHEMAQAGDVEGIEKHYRALFDEVNAAWAAARKEDASVKSLEDERLEEARLALNDATGLLNVPPKPEFAFDEETLAEYNRLMEEARLYESSAPDEPAAMGVADGEVVTSLPIHIRGSHLNLGEPVAREFPEVMRVSSVRPILPRGSSGRLELARWMASTQHPLTARVYVNRIWRWHFGTGIVATTDNFGALGDRPSHPELLDWLARNFMESGWSTRELHRLILSSSAYQMASRHPDEAALAETDPENRLLAKFPMQRLEAEQIRDAILAVSGRLDDSLGGKTVPLRNRQFVFNHTSVDHTKYDSLRRAIYLPVIRNNLYTLFEQFDFPDPTMPTGSRNTTTVAPQALLLLNSDLMIDSADAMAGRVLESTAADEGRVQYAYELALGRTPTPSEMERALGFVSGLTSQSLTDAATVDPAAERKAWALLCQSLFASNEFVYVR
ncbi:PSD1 and planctomycete cytochrome C domain-containing protein [Maioricimonas sp. JC845]|uniref:PSD1 and planctomycete cytochrome C domain-containing protein n=1 Tax=Maioricimonas sp. JC845 TaxID=3232138 RepID=UPI00345AF4F4